MTFNKTLIQVIAAVAFVLPVAASAADVSLLNVS